jgi:hypothetical protein
VETAAHLGGGELSRVLRGKRAAQSISLDKLCDIADALNVTVDWLLGRDSAAMHDRIGAAKRAIIAAKEAREREKAARRQNETDDEQPKSSQPLLIQRDPAKRASGSGSQKK